MSTIKLLVKPFLGIIILTLLVGACAPASPATVEVTKEVVVKETVEVPVKETVVTETEKLVTPTPAHLEGTIDIMMWGGASDALMAYFPEFQKANPDVQINIQDVVWDEQSQIYQATLAAGTDLPDAMLIDDDRVQAFFDTGGLMDVTDYVAPYADQIAPFKLATVTYEGRQYAFPWDSGPMAIFYNKGIFDEAGIDPDSIKTWEDYTAAGETILEATGGRSKLTVLNRTDAAIPQGPLLSIMWGRGVGFVDDSGKVILDQSEDWLFAANLVKEWYDKGLVAESGDIYTPEYFAALQDGTAATTHGAVWFAGFLQSSIPDAEDQFRVMPWPEGSSANIGGSSFVIPEGAEDPELTAAFLKDFLFSVAGNRAAYYSQKIWPTYIPALEDPTFQQPDAWYGDQPIGTIFVDASKVVPAYPRPPDYLEMLDIFAKHYTSALNGEKTVEEALKAAADEIRLKTGRQ